MRVRNPLKANNGEDNGRWEGGKASHPLIQTYYQMVYRCTYPFHARYDAYGGRGITVCPEWLEDFWAFVKDMGERPPGMVLDRIDNDGNYSPENCRWTTHSISVANRRRLSWDRRERNDKGQYI